MSMLIFSARKRTPAADLTKRGLQQNRFQVITAWPEACLSTHDADRQSLNPKVFESEDSLTRNLV